MRPCILLSFTVLLWACPAQAQAADWRVHNDAQSGLAMQYPADIFTVDAGRTEIGSGRQLRSPDGRAELAIYSMPNARSDTPRSYLANTLLVPPSSIVYRRVTDRYFVISSIRNQRIYYSRCNFGRWMRCFLCGISAGREARLGSHRHADEPFPVVTTRVRR